MIQQGKGEEKILVRSLNGFRHRVLLHSTSNVRYNINLPMKYCLLIVGDLKKGLTRPLSSPLGFLKIFCGFLDF